MKKLLLVALLLVPAAVFADATEVHGTKGGLPYFKATDTVSRKGIVVAVDAAKRDVSLHSMTYGDTVIVTCGPEVKNFAQIAVGDTVRMKYTETLMIHVEESGTPSMTTETATAEAQPGEKPRGGAAQTTQFSGTITAIDKAKGTATLKGYRGNEFEVTPRMRENLDKVKVGQLVVFTYQEALGVSVEKVSAKPAAKSSTKKK
ncbi:MAG: hypothetical protein ACRENS_05300 [Candidatus Eiseniibacteriota bacterium]